MYKGETKRLMRWTPPALFGHGAKTTIKTWVMEQQEIQPERDLLIVQYKFIKARLPQSIHRLLQL